MVPIPPDTSYTKSQCVVNVQNLHLLQLQLQYKTWDLGSVSSTRLDTMFKSTVGALVFLLAAVSAAPHPDGAAAPPSSLIKQAFYIFPPIPKGGAVAGGK